MICKFAPVDPPKSKVKSVAFISPTFKEIHICDGYTKPPVMIAGGIDWFALILTPAVVS